MSPNKQIVEQYLEGFRRSDHAMVLACLTDDVEWILPGAFHLHGKPAFDAEIENPAFVGRPAITVSLMVEENDVVVVEGAVRSQRLAGGLLHAQFCDVFLFRDGLIQRLTSYLAILE